MKIVTQPQYGPMFCFTDASVYWTLHLISDGKRMGRARLSEEVGIGEGSMRKIISTLKEWDLVSVKQTGITITKSGLNFLSQIPIKVVDVSLGDSVLGMHSQGILALGVAEKVNNGLEQRDVGIKYGAMGCTTIVIRDGILMIPPDWNIDDRNPELAYEIRKNAGITQSDVLIVGSADDKHLAIEAAINAALELI